MTIKITEVSDADLAAASPTYRRALMDERERLMDVLEANGGRGVDTAERIDEIDRILDGGS